MRLLVELVPAIAPVLPGRLDAVRDDETEEKSERNPEDQHVPGGLGAPGSAGGCCASALHMFGGGVGGRAAALGDQVRVSFCNNSLVLTPNPLLDTCASLTKQNAHSRSARRRTRRRSAAGRIRDAAAGAPSSQQMLSVPSHRGPSAKGAQRGPQANTGSPFLSLSLPPFPLLLRRKAHVVLLGCTPSPALGCFQGRLGNPTEGTVARNCADSCSFRADSIVTYKLVFCVQVN